MDDKRSPTFSRNYKRRFRCRKCKSYIGSKKGGVVYSRMTDNKNKLLKCRKCGYEGYYAPPAIKEYNEKNNPIVYWNADENGLEGTTTLVDHDFD